ncbi:MAG: hypothetical protein KatS3mg028_1287 [Bacteroidia bacterium]|nr:MAG: hypothetical protein KatS3mg028_1287 [Bacteroidia bacterium]
MKKENLEDYLGAYSNEFKFKNENELYLSRFAKFILDDIDKNKWIESYLSLGIGHQIVSKSIISRLNKKHR